jgi:hypothetical protein
VAAALSCGDNEIDCPARHPEAGSCISAVALALRNTDQLFAAQADVDVYSLLLDEAAAREPLFSGIAVPRYYTDLHLEYQIGVDNRSISSQWSAGDFETGYPAVDEMFIQLDPQLTEYNPITQAGGSEDLAFVTFGSFFSENYFVANVDSVPGLVVENMNVPEGDATWTWLTVQHRVGTSSAWLDGSIRWGDCLVHCDGYHRLRAVIDGDRVTGVYDLGGDPLPTYLTLRPTTTPWVD